MMYHEPVDIFGQLVLVLGNASLYVNSKSRVSAVVLQILYPGSY